MRKLYGYGIALLSVLVALILTLSLESLLQPTVLVLFYLVPLFSAFYGGHKSGLVSVLLAGVISRYFFFEPRHTYALPNGSSAFRLVIFVAVLWLIGFVSASLRDAKRQAEQSLDQLRDSEEHLKRIKERFELATSTVKGLVYEWNSKTNLIERTQGLVDLIGYDPEEADPSPDWWYQLVHPDDQADLRQTNREAFAKGDTGFAVEYRIRHRNGQYRYVWDRARIERDRTGEPIRVIGFNLDITDRKSAEDALRESEARFRMMADTAPMLVWMSGVDQQHNYFNKTWLDFTERTLEQEMGNGWITGIHPDDRQYYLKTYRAAFDARQPFSMDYRLQRHDGDYRWMLDKGVPRFTPDGEFLGYIGSCIDISDLKYAEETQRYLAEVSNLLSSSLDYETTLISVAQLTVPRLADWCTVHMLEEDGTVQPLAIAHVNPEKVAWAQKLNQKYPFDPKQPRGVAQVLRTGRPELYPYISDALLEASARDAEHLEALREVGFSSAMIVPLATQEQILGAISFIYAESGQHYNQTDLTLAMELARRAALAVDNARLYRTAQQDREKAEAANRSKDEFLATLSHELRTPLNAMLGWMQLLNHRQLDESTEKRALETVLRNTKVLKTIIEDLLDVSRITSGKLRLNVRPLELTSVIEAAIDAVRPAAIAKQIQLQLTSPDLPADSPDPGFNDYAGLTSANLPPDDLGTSLYQVMGDPDRLQQVIWNLLSNAVKFTDRGGQIEVRVSIVNHQSPTANEGQPSVVQDPGVTTGDDRQLALYHTPLPQAQIQIVDTGIGISPDFLPHVFERFRQADMSTTKIHGGLGLGLAIVRHLVEMHGGTVWVESEGLGKGSTFTVHLPLLSSQLQEPGKPNSTPLPVHSPSQRLTNL
ncbi:PAS domain-containing protein [Oscillatoria sp. FACHB-1407]|uniref:PAS domain-containing protein n=1 Tax=Oscillatoria sp. FACHB-1407 TaxID=2692847 RepID=UPI00168243F1|nr:PAS domain-containing protein [Oscillatoria sp. FACHB-1407]MBD2465063.1 PAS domain-containing protein [Oscillatoria sp. FACHB-1407]